MTTPLPHISVCVCTFRRPEPLRRLLEKLCAQETGETFTFSIVVADNDASESGRGVAMEFVARGGPNLVYCVEPEQNIALARNRALANAVGDYVAFIDDDEAPVDHWLRTLLGACRKYQADGILGPVKPWFEAPPPNWVKAGGFFERPTHETGFVIDWTEGRTGNVLLKREILKGMDPPFRSQFGSGGEDRDFFRRMIGSGRVFVWCDEAVVHEFVPSIRWQRSFMLRRALLRGKVSLNHRRGIGVFAKSLFALAGYTLALPVLLVLGQHLAMRYLIKACDHAGRLLAAFGLNPIRDKYVVE